ncbi:hypothetical protein [Pseudomonas aeruginosa]|uniref:hypothetical protein n=1 Tax=Pseudomonas aeruginosa TaxID=287 RepID=UPI003D27218F
MEILRVGLLCGRGVARRLDGPVQAEDSALALAHFGEQVGVAFLHVHEQLGLSLELTLLGLDQDASQLGWGQPLGRVVGELFGQARQVRGLLLAQLLGSQGLP